MANTVIALKKSATPSAAPGDLANGEIAINYADGVLYYKNAAGYIAQITSGTGGGGNAFGTVNANGTLVVADTSGDVFSLIPGDNISITADAINDTITISASGTVSSTDQIARDTAVAAFAKANTANTTADLAYNKANAANVLAFDTGVGANAYAASIANTIAILAYDKANSSNVNATFANNVAIAAFDYANGISFTQDNTIANLAYDKANSANVLAYNTGIGANAYADVVGISANTYANNTFVTNANGTIIAQGHYGIGGQPYIVNDAYTGLTVGGSRHGSVYLKDAADRVTVAVTTGFNDRYFVAYENNQVDTAGIIKFTTLEDPDPALIAAYDKEFFIGSSTGYTEKNGIRFYPNTASNGRIAFVTLNSERMYVLHDGNVAIGRDTADYKVDVVGLVNAAGFLINGSPISFDLTPANSWANIVVLTANTIANLAYDKANTANILAYQISGALDGVNTTVAYANSAWDKANAANILANDANINATFANTVAIAAFDYANGISFTQDNTIANLAYDKANAANVLAFDTGIGANTYAGVMANSTNAYADATFVKLTATQQTINGDITVTGNLIVSGNTVAYSANNLIVNDPLIILANNNISDALDIGFVGHYQNTNGYNVHTGFYREHETKMYYLFNDYDQEPGTINHIGAFSNNMTLAVLNADLITSNLTLAGVNTVITLRSSYDKGNAAHDTANASYDKANAANLLALAGNQTANAAYDHSNNVLYIANLAYDQANVGGGADVFARDTANAAYDKANSANLLAYNALANTDGAAFQGNLYITGSANVVNVLTANNVAFGVNSSKDKIRLYDTEIPYAIGMANRMTFGPLRDDWAMTFQMNDDIDRGFWWGDVAHTNAQGAMALTTDGNLYVASKIRLGYGETDTTDQENWKYNIDVAGNVNAASFLVNSTEVTSISNSFASATIAGANTEVGSAANVYAGTILQANIAAANGWTNAVFGFANNKFLANANPGVANNYAYTGNLYITTGSAGVSGNVLINRTTDSTLGKNVKIDIFGSVNARSYFANGVVVGATGGGSDDVFYENSQNVKTSYTITTNKNAMSTGPVTINSGVTVTVPSGSRWVVI